MIKLDQNTLKELLDYNSKTGVLVWKKRDRKFFTSDYNWRAWNTRYSGKAAGHKLNGYIGVRIFRKLYQGHRLAWLYMTGSWPKDELDHKNRIRDDNSYCNLREVTSAQQNQNISLSRNNTSGKIGVWRNKSRRTWIAQIRLNGSYIYLGRFRIFKEAVAARLAAEKHFGWLRGAD